MNLDELRGEITKINGEILSLFLRRMELSAQVADWKRERGLPVLDASREEAILSDVAERAGEKMAPYARELFAGIMALSRRYQESLLTPPFGLVGEKLGHSFSPQIHELLGSAPYALHELAPDELESFIRTGSWRGLNVTVPYKRAVIPFCDELTDRAKAIGSVNTLLRRADGTILGDNTDYFGFSRLVDSSGVSVAGKKCVVFGSGGASLTVRAVLRDMGAGEIVTVSRSGEDNYENLSRHADAAILVNATPVGMAPHCDETPTDPRLFPNAEAAFDLIYNPARTDFLALAEEAGMVTRNGLLMLVAQAAESSALFLGKSADVDKNAGITDAIDRQTRNIALIGMAGCGKSSVGRALAERTGRAFVDLDETLEQKSGMTIPEYFAKFGEDSFRELETQTLREASCKSALVLATGGGVVTREENLRLLRRSSRTVWLRRDPDDLPTEGRPLSQSVGVRALYEARRGKYESWAELTVDNTGIGQTAEKIAKELKL